MRTAKQVEARIADKLHKHAAGARVLRELAGKPKAEVLAHKAKWEPGARVRRLSRSTVYYPGLVAEVLAYQWLLGDDENHFVAPPWWGDKA